MLIYHYMDISNLRKLAAVAIVVMMAAGLLSYFELIPWSGILGITRLLAGLALVYTFWQARAYLHVRLDKEQGVGEQPLLSPTARLWKPLSLAVVILVPILVIFFPLAIVSAVAQGRLTDLDMRNYVTAFHLGMQLLIWSVILIRLYLIDLAPKCLECAPVDSKMIGTYTIGGLAMLMFLVLPEPIKFLSTHILELTRETAERSYLELGVQIYSLAGIPILVGYILLIVFLFRRNKSLKS